MFTRRDFIKTSTAAAALGSSKFVGASIAPKEPRSELSPHSQADVIVVGAGGAGLTAAVTAAENGASVIVLEKMPTAGGNTLRTSGAFNAVNPNELGEDSVDRHFAETLSSGRYRGEPELVRVLTSHAYETLLWLKSKGVDFAAGVYQAFGGVYPRAHNSTAPFGAGYVEALVKRAQELKIPILTEHKVCGFELDSNGRVCAVKVVCDKEQKAFTARKGVVVACGGFGANAEMCGLFDPRTRRLPTTNQPGATGEVLRQLEDVGACLTGMDYIELMPISADGNRIISTVNIVNRVIFIDGEGNRFIDEESVHEVVSNAFMSKNGSHIFSVFDENGHKSMRDDMRSVFDSEADKGAVFKERTIEDLAIRIGVPVENLKRSVQRLNEKLRAEKLTLTPPFYSARLTLAVHYTMGGVRINADAQVLDRSGRIIPGLFAAGEVTGGIHGTNRLGGNGIADAFVFGRIAGRTVATLKR